MTEDELLPCPFCGGAEMQFKENGRTWRGHSWSEPISVSIMHWCPLVEGQPNRLLERVGRDRDSAIASWNLRVQPK